MKMTISIISVEPIHLKGLSSGQSESQLIINKLLVHEGEIELKSQDTQEMISNHKHSESDENSKSRISKNISKSAVCNAKGKSGKEKMNMLCKTDTKSQGPDHISDEASEKSESESSFTLKRPSLVDFYLKTQSCSLAKLNLKVVGFKTYFNGYVEDIEVYAEPVDPEESVNKDIPPNDHNSDIN